MEWSEITRELFVFITENEYTTQVENKELYNRFLYNVILPSHFYRLLHLWSIASHSHL